MRLRVLDTGLQAARRNAAISAALLASVDAGEAATLRFHRFAPACVVGRFQDLATELDLDACKGAGVEIARRVTGGGAVIMGPGILAFDLVVPGGGALLDEVPRRAGEAMVGALADLGFAATRPTAGSVAIGGLKVSGSAGRLARRAMLHQATLIVDLAYAPSLALLRRRTEGGKSTADPRHRVTDLVTAWRDSDAPHAEVPAGGRPRSTRDRDASFEARLRRAPQDEEGGSSRCASTVIPRLAARLAEALRLEPEPDTLSEDEESRTAALLAEFIGRDEFVLTGEVEREAA